MISVSAFFFFSSRRRHTRFDCDWSSDVCSSDLCDVVTYLVEDPDPSGPFGAKEVGQGPLLPVPPAIANAVYDAVDRKSTRLNSSHSQISYAVFCLKKKKTKSGRTKHRSRARMDD